MESERRVGVAPNHISNLTSANKSNAALDSIANRLSTIIYDEALTASVPKSRSGLVLGKNTILKADNYSMHSKARDPSLLIPISGAPNFRRVSIGDSSIYAVAQPTSYGICGVMNFIMSFHREHSQTATPPTFFWINLREEPMVYLNQRPFVLRELARPFQNPTTYAGMIRERLEKMEARLREDVIKEANYFNGNLLVHEEGVEEHKLSAVWESISGGGLMTPGRYDTWRHVVTPAGLFEHLKQSYGFNVTYFRLPTTPELAPDIRYYDTILNLLRDMPTDAHIIFNCQLGAGRSTAGMVISYLIASWRSARSPSPDLDGPSVSGIQSPKIEPHVTGSYNIVLQLLSTIENGMAIKSRVDAVIDKCSAVVNLRDRIHDDHQKIQSTRDSDARQLLINRVLEDLIRYYHLIAFGCYLEDLSRIQSQHEELPSYSEWLKSRPEIERILATGTADPEDLCFIAASANTEEKERKVIIGVPTESLKDSDALTVISSRSGQVLGRNTIVKYDHFPTPDARLSIKIDGVPNFRNIPYTKYYHLYGAGMPTCDGVSNTIGHIIKSNGEAPHVFWINLREEPVIYVNCQPCVLRQRNKIFKNLDMLSGITSERVEQMENRLKEDLMKEAEMYSGCILVHDETAAGEIVPTWVSVLDNNRGYKIETAHEVYAKYGSACQLSYHRIPLTPEKPPELVDFDDIVTVIRNVPKKSHVIFNCQMGRGRSTVAVVIASLITSWLYEPGGPQVLGSNEPWCRKGEYKSILHLLRILDEGPYRKQQVDVVIDNCSQLYNIRDIIVEKDLTTSRNTREAKIFEEKSVDRLKTYFLLIAFNSYLSEAINNNFAVTFSQWIESRTEFTKLIKELESDGLEIEEVPLHLPEESNIAVIKHRSGNVLGPSTIIKCDHFPGCQRKGLLPNIPGAPNFRKVESVNVYGVAIPTIEGIQKVLDHLHASPSEEKQEKVIWTNLREEPVIYVNGRPFVLRFSGEPFANLEYTGIDYERVEIMEDRLKKDILNEAAKYHGRVLLHDEKEDGLIEIWETVSESTVQTPKEAYEQLRKCGYNVVYNRLPITDEQTPEEKDFDDLVAIIKRDINRPTHLIFNCQMGRGRTTTGMVIACMMRTSNLPLEITPMPPSLSLSLDEKRYTKGEYELILRLVRILENGVETKLKVDKCIDMCSTMQNLREAIEALKIAADTSTTEKAKKVAYVRGVNYLIRYFFLCAFQAYLQEQQPLLFINSFSTWAKSRPELYNLLLNVDLN